MTDQEPAPEPRVSQLDRVKQEYTQAAREILQRSMRGVAKTKLTPDMLTLAGVSLCLAGAVLVGFEERNEMLFFWLGGFLFVVGSVADILDGALARAASKGTVFGAFLDSTFDRLGEAAMLTSIGLVFMTPGVTEQPAIESASEFMHSIPDPATVHRHLAEIDVFEVYNARLLRDSFNDEALRLARKYRLLQGAGSDAHVLQGVGTGAVRMRRFDGPEEFLLSLRTAEILRRPKSLAYLQSLKWMAQVKERVL